MLYAVWQLLTGVGDIYYSEGSRRHLKSAVCAPHFQLLLILFYPLFTLPFTLHGFNLFFLAWDFHPPFSIIAT